MPSASPSEPPRGTRVAVIMDGNGRWAERHGVSVTEGHRAGGDALRRVTEAALELGVSELTVYGFSTENFGRDPDEVAGIMQLFMELVEREAPIMVERRSRMCFMGRRELLGTDIRERMRWAEELTAGGTELTLCIAFGYGGRAEIVDAARAAVAEVGVDALDEQSLRRHLYRPELGDPDVIVRTAGEQRTSNFLVWQSAYSELVFTDTLWPDFQEADLRAALLEYGARDRRFGGRLTEASTT
ncbi:MAG: undecaprenyl diphosphate synthase [Thermoleophilia bacterium]|jgi:undecaprenyl diphosphate synthase|nr:undecaprenyl diphosphate synthase [Thermoleophilia bacterium]